MSDGPGQHLPWDLSGFRRIVVLTGPGVSAASGLLPCRGPDGLWDDARRTAEQARLCTAAAWRNEPQAVWALFGHLRQALAVAQPTAAQRALAQFEAGLAPDVDFLLVTLNTDGLHQLAGSQRVTELHGNLRTTRCSHPICRLPPFGGDRHYPPGPPPCPACDGALRPDVVLVGEALPVDAHWRVRRALREADLLLAIGTADVAEPAASLLRWAREAGARTACVQTHPQALPDPAFDHTVHGPADALLPALLGVSG